MKVFAGIVKSTAFSRPEIVDSIKQFYDENCLDMNHIVMLTSEVASAMLKGIMELQQYPVIPPLLENYLPLWHNHITTMLSHLYCSTTIDYLSFHSNLCGHLRIVMVSDILLFSTDNTWGNSQGGNARIALSADQLFKKQTDSSVVIAIQAILTVATEKPNAPPTYITIL